MLAVREVRPDPQQPTKTGGKPPTIFQSYPKPLWRLVLAAFVFSLGNSSDTFLILRSSQLGMSFGIVILMYAMYNIVYASMSEPLGRLSDTIGRKPLLITGWAIYAAVYAGFAVFRAAWAPWLYHGGLRSVSGDDRRCHRTGQRCCPRRQTHRSSACISPRFTSANSPPAYWPASSITFSSAVDTSCCPRPGSRVRPVGHSVSDYRAVEKRTLRPHLASNAKLADSSGPMNEWEFTQLAATWMQQAIDADPPCRFRHARVEQGSAGSQKRRDITLLDAGQRPLLTGEVKMPYQPAGNSPFRYDVVRDARNKARAANCKFCFTWNINRLVVWPTTPQAKPGHSGATMTPTKRGMILSPFTTPATSHWNRPNQRSIALSSPFSTTPPALSAVSYRWAGVAPTTASSKRLKRPWNNPFSSRPMR